MTRRLDRRTFVRSVGAAAVAGAVAGCSGSSGDGGDGGSDGGGDGGDGGSDGSDGGSDGSDGGSDGSDGGSGGDGGSDGSDSGSGGDGGSGGSVPSAVSEYLSDVGNFDGSLADETGSSSVTVQVGTQANGGAYGFGPAAIRVSSGTTVTWEWTGKGASHNVVAEDGASFESELVTEEGHTFEHTFDSTGVVTYFCTPHKALGMKGAVVVE
jgi:halocyanin-like protein